MEKPVQKKGSGPTQLPYGSVKELAEGISNVSMDLQSVDQTIGSQEYTPIHPDPEIDQLLLRPTDRPNEPLTHGANFGPGQNGLTVQNPSDTTGMRAQLARTLIETGTTQGERELAQRISGGE